MATKTRNPEDRGIVATRIHEEVPNTALQLTSTDAAHSALRSPCLLSVLAAECHVRLAENALKR